MPQTESTSVTAGFECQVENLIAKNYHQHANLSAQAFTDLLAPLRDALTTLPDNANSQVGRIPFVIVVKSDLVSADEMITLVERNGKPAIVDTRPHENLTPYRPIEEVELPDGEAYLLVDVDTGADTLNVTPNDALLSIVGASRTPLTLEEGLAVATHYPEVIKPGHGFSLLGSRSGDKRVCALWISKGRPKLGWCWAGNPHTWLGSASAEKRI